MASDEKPSFDPKAFFGRYGGAIAKFHSNHTVYAQGDAANGMFYLQAGKVKLSVISEQGKEAVIAILEPGDLFGKDCLTDLPQRIATAVTMTDCILAKLDIQSVTRARRENGLFSDFLISYLVSENVRLREDLLAHIFNSSEKRLARVLLLLANYGNDADDDGVIAEIDQQTLAKMVGTTRARINFFMNKFRRLGFIDYHRDIHVHRSLLKVLLRD